MPKLFIVATPIGNLKDITLRALEVLRAVDVVLAEDTRVAKKLLSHYDIRKPVWQFHEHSSPIAIEKIVAVLEDKDCALVTDAGTPAVSDPGQRLISAIRHAPYAVDIVPIPGPSALTAALSISDIDCSEFLFLGFPPHKKGRQKFFARVSDSAVPAVLFESTHRIVKTLNELRAVLGDRHINIGRELTKLHEDIFRGTIGEALEYIVGEKQRGEFILIVSQK